MILPTISTEIPAPVRKSNPSFDVPLTALGPNESFALPVAARPAVWRAITVRTARTKTSPSPERYCTKTLVEDGVKVVRVWRLS